MKNEDAVGKALSTKASGDNTTLVPEKAKDSFANFFETYKKDFAMVIPAHIKVEKIMRLAISACRRNPALMTCDRMTVIGAVLEATALGLEVNTPLQQAYLIPFKNNKTRQTEAQLIIGYRGYIDLFYNHPKVITVWANAVYDNDIFKYKYGTEEFLDHTPYNLGDRGEIVGFYAYAKMVNDAYRFCYMSIFEVNKIRDENSAGYAAAKSAGSQENPWIKHYESMGCKTVLRKLEKFVPKSTELSNATGLDFQTINPMDPDKLVGVQPTN